MPAGGDPRDGARLRHRAARDDLLDAGHHRASHRRRQRAGAHQPGAAHRPRRPLGLGHQPAARPEQRPGRRRHGRAARSAARASSTSRTTRCAPKFDRAWGVPMPPERGWHLSGMFDAMERGELKALYVIGENPVQSEADQHRAAHAARRPRHAWSCRTCSSPTRAAIADVVLPGRGRRVRVRGHGHLERAARAARAPHHGAGRRERARTSTIIFALARQHGRTTGARPTPSACGTSCARCRRCTPA